MTTKVIGIDDIRLDGDTQPREHIDEQVVADYAADMTEGDEFPPVDVFFDGSDHWLANGFHRVNAAIRNGWKTIEATIHKGGRREAVLFAVGSNSDHGLRRTNADKRRAVMKLLKDDEWVAWSDREVARRAHVSHNFVGTVRSSLSSDDSEPRTYTDKHGNQSVMNTSNIGRKPATETTTEIVNKDTGEVIENPVTVETTTPCPETPREPQPVSDALTFAAVAISQLERISKNDPHRRDAMVEVRDRIGAMLRGKRRRATGKEHAADPRNAEDVVGELHKYVHDSPMTQLSVVRLRLLTEELCASLGMKMIA